MSIFLDTATSEEIREVARWGILSGVTTNPTLISKTPEKSYEMVIREIAELVNGDISAETISQDTDGMLAEGRHFAGWHPNVVVKAPSTPAGWVAVKHLKAEGIRTNVTRCFSATQARFAELAGAYIISPFVGRLDDISQNGMQVVRDTVETYRKHQFPTLTLAASIRYLLHIIEAARAGADIATMPFKVLEQTAQHSLTEQGLACFAPLYDLRAVEDAPPGLIHECLLLSASLPAIDARHRWSMRRVVEVRVSPHRPTGQKEARCQEGSTLRSSMSHVAALSHLEPAHGMNQWSVRERRQADVHVEIYPGRSGLAGRGVYCQ